MNGYLRKQLLTCISRYLLCCLREGDGEESGIESSWYWYWIDGVKKSIKLFPIAIQYRFESSADIEGNISNYYWN